MRGMDSFKIFTHLSLLQLKENSSEVDRAVETFDRLWKIRNRFEIQKTTLLKFYNPCVHLAAHCLVERKDSFQCHRDRTDYKGRSMC
jgi:hypothetical protein